jgi:signal transduction histidine kinase
MRAFDDTTRERVGRERQGLFRRILRDPAMVFAAVIAVVYVAFFLFFFVSALSMDAARETPAVGVETVAVGPSGESLLDFGSIRTPADLFTPETQARFQPAGGRMPVAGMQYFRDGALWVRFRVPDIVSVDPQRTVRLSDPRVRHAQLVWRNGGEINRLDWSFDDERRRIGFGTRTPVFHFEAGSIEGAEMYLGFTSLSVLRGSVFVETRRAYEAWDLRATVIPSILSGALIAIGIYLCVTGIALRDGPLAAAGIMSFAMMTTIFGGPGLFHVYVLPESPSMADFVAYIPKPLSVSSWLIFLIAYLRLRSRARWLSNVLLFIALILPFQALLAAFKVGLGVDAPIMVTSALPILIALLAGGGALVWFAVRGDRGARIFLLCWLPLMVGMIIRSLIVMFPQPETAQALQDDPFVDVVFSMMALAMAMVIDIQARERALRRDAEANEQRLRGFSHIASRSFFEVAPDGTLTSVAGPLVPEMGLEAGRDLGETMSALLEPGEGGFVDKLAQARRRGTSLRDVEIAAKTRDGRSRWYAFDAEPWTENGSGATGLRGTIEDITAQVERRSTIAQQTRLAAMGQIAGGIAHEVNNLLHPVVNLARRVRDHHVRDDEARRLLDLVIDSGKQAGQVVESVLETVSPTRRRGPILPVGVAVERAVAAAVAAVPARVQVAVEVELVERPDVPLGEMLQVIGNLVQNAAQAIDGDGRIVVSLQSDADRGAVLGVRDNGRGMDEELRRTALQPFVTTRGDGTGLGLASVAAIVSGWNGTIEFFSAPGEGTSVIVRIPVLGEGNE